MGTKPEKRRFRFFEDDDDEPMGLWKPKKPRGSRTYHDRVFLTDDDPSFAGRVLFWAGILAMSAALILWVLR